MYKETSLCLLETQNTKVKKCFKVIFAFPLKEMRNEEVCSGL